MCVNKSQVQAKFREVQVNEKLTSHGGRLRVVIGVYGGRLVLAARWDLRGNTSHPA
jgi:hypothetical protein